jgi:hypothetical protein
MFISSAYAQDVTPAQPTPEVIVPTETPLPLPTIEPPTIAPPTLIPTPTAIPLPPPTVRIEASPSWQVGMPGEIVLVLDTLNSAPINTLELMCSFSPAGALANAQVGVGVFNPDALVINQGLQADGNWIFAVSQPSAPLAGGVVARVMATGALAGGLNVGCTVTGVGMDGLRLPLLAAPLALLIADAPTQPPSPTAPLETPTLVMPEASPTLEMTPELPPTLEVTPDPLATVEMTPDPLATVEVTPEITPTVEITPTPEIIPPTDLPPPPDGSISAQVALSDAAPSGVVVSLRDASGAVVMLVNTDDVGNVRFDGVQPGDYTVVVEAPGYLPADVPITLGEDGAALGEVELLAGDVVPSETPVIDELDVVQFSVWYGNPAVYDPRGDFNRDGVIDLLDLRAIAQNLRRAG